MTTTKRTIADSISSRTSLSKVRSAEVLDSLLEIISKPFRMAIRFLSQDLASSMSSTKARAPPGIPTPESPFPWKHAAWCCSATLSGSETASTTPRSPP